MHKKAEKMLFNLSTYEARLPFAGSLRPIQIQN